ncbi:colipase-like [Brachyhypopomus gauderio]|uniref:colipase-like n=1 Tax=Brachyhypopomus gauderio TaxID=698409 RepID=UPI0040429BE1
MRALLVLALCLVAMALGSSLHTPEDRGIIINLNNGELCLNSLQCKSSCCLRHSSISLARCAPRAAEKDICSKKSLYGTYYYCPCENGLKCEGDVSIGGAITNTNFGNCADPQSAI